MSVSNCCGVEPYGNFEDMGLCPKCKDHCEYLEEIGCECCDQLFFEDEGYVTDENQQCPKCAKLENK